MRQFLRKTLQIQSAFLIYILHIIFLFSLTLCNTSFLERDVQLTFHVLLIYFAKFPRFSTIQSHAPNAAFI
jgi:positive regulator of sigma E activity